MTWPVPADSRDGPLVFREIVRVFETGSFNEWRRAFCLNGPHQVATLQFDDGLRLGA